MRLRVLRAGAHWHTRILASCSPHDRGIQRPTPRVQVPFAAVPDLVGSRRVLLHGGVAYVAQEQVPARNRGHACGHLILILMLGPAAAGLQPTYNPRPSPPVQVYSLVVGAFRAHLSAALAELAQRWGAFAASEAGRLAPLVEAMPTRCEAVRANNGVHWCTAAMAQPMLWSCACAQPLASACDFPALARPYLQEPQQQQGQGAARRGDHRGPGGGQLHAPAARKKRRVAMALAAPARSLRLA